MSLQVWLPLNGDLTQQGLSTIKVTNNGATVNNSGKIGKCYYFNGSQQWLQLNDNLGDFYNNDWSIACWLKPTDSTRSVIISEYNGTGASNVAIELTTARVIRLYWNGSPDINFTTAGGLTLNEWTHVCLTKQGRIVKLFFNGELKQTYTNSSDFSVRTSACQPRIGDDYRGNSGNTVSYQGYINDFRMYNHTLSTKEIKELSKGLVLHYKLDNKNEITTNLITTEDCLSSTAYNAAKGKYGYNADSNIQKTVGDFNGKRCTKVSMITAGVSARPYIYFSNLFTSNGTNQPEYKTLSFDYYGTIGTYLNPYKLGSGNGTCTWKNVTTGVIGSFTNTGNVSVVPNKWNHIELTFHGTTDANAEWGYIVLGDTHTSASTNYWLFANAQLEIKDHATPYVGVGGSRTYTVEPDCSGYGHNGVVTGTLTHSITSPRYDGCVHISATNQKIRASELTTSGFGNSYSFSWWAKCNSWSNLMHWGFSDGIRLNGIYNGTLWNTGDGSNNPLYNIGTTTQVTASDTNWHHWVMTGNGTKCYVYKDGILWAEAKTYKAISGTSIYINGWDSSTSYSNTNLDIVDFRIYATALSAEDVLELYHTSASVDDKGNAYMYELKEV